MLKEMCTKNWLPCLWKASGVKIRTDRLYVTLAVDRVRNECTKTTLIMSGETWHNLTPGPARGMRTTLLNI